MKNIFTLLLILSVSFSYSQLDEGQKINFDFIKVEKENIEEYEAYMTCLLYTTPSPRDS